MTEVCKLPNQGLCIDSEEWKPAGIFRAQLSFCVRRACLPGEALTRSLSLENIAAFLCNVAWIPAVWFCLSLIFKQNVYPGKVFLMWSQLCLQPWSLQNLCILPRLIALPHMFSLQRLCPRRRRKEKQLTPLTVWLPPTPWALIF